MNLRVSYSAIEIRILDKMTSKFQRGDYVRVISRTSGATVRYTDKIGTVLKCVGGPYGAINVDILIHDTELDHEVQRTFSPDNLAKLSPLEMLAMQAE